MSKAKSTLPPVPADALLLSVRETAALLGRSENRIGHRSQPREQPRITRRIGRHQGVPTAQTCREQDRGLELQRWTDEHGTPMIMSLENSMISQRRARSSLQPRQSQQPQTRSSTNTPGPAAPWAASRHSFSSEERLPL
jgi:hypothetical protein